MGKLFVLLLLALLLLVSGCTAETGKVLETTKLTISDSLNESPESIEDVRREFEEFEKSQADNLSEQNETLEEAAAEYVESETIPEEQTKEETSAQTEPVQKQCPSCEDNNSCTADSCSEDTDFECKYEQIIPCCGNGECEAGENWTACQDDCECALDCGPCESLENESCSCLPKTECIPDGCCPANCAYPSDQDCPKPSVVFSEIYCNPNASGKEHEWLEIYNNGTVAIGITKWRFFENEVNHYIENVSDQTTLNPDSYAVIAENSAQFILDYPDFTGLLFDSSFDLKIAGEELALKTGATGEIIDSVYYNSTWGGEKGFSLEKIDPNGPNTEQNWNQSIVEKGTPGQKNSIDIAS